MKQAKKKVSLTLDADLVEKLKELAENEDRALSQYINKLLKTYVGSKQEHNSAMYFRL